MNKKTNKKQKKHTDMKILTITLALLISGLAAQASSFNLLTFTDANGNELHMPVHCEEAEVELPIRVAQERTSPNAGTNPLIIDVFSLAHPEPDADDIDIDLEKIFRELKK